MHGQSPSSRHRFFTKRFVERRKIGSPGFPGFEVNPNVNGAVILDGIQVGSWLETMYDSCDSHWHKGRGTALVLFYDTHHVGINSEEP